MSSGRFVGRDAPVGEARAQAYELRRGPLDDELDSLEPWQLLLCGRLRRSSLRLVEGTTLQRSRAVAALTELLPSLLGRLGTASVRATFFATSLSGAACRTSD
jgi:hypothetical protein